MATRKISTPKPRPAPKPRPKSVNTMAKRAAKSYVRKRSK